MTSGIGQRRLIGQIAIGQGIAYWLIVLLAWPMTAGTRLQAGIMPLWAWGGLLVAVGGLFWWTAYHYRRQWQGRLLAVVMLGLQVWFASTFFQAGSMVVLGQYVPIVVVVFGEAVFFRGRGVM